MGRVLANEGHTVSFACDGVEFLQVLRGNSDEGDEKDEEDDDFTLARAPLLGKRSVVFDAVLIDRHMPKLDGPEAVR